MAEHVFVTIIYNGCYRLNPHISKNPTDEMISDLSKGDHLWEDNLLFVNGECPLCTKMEHDDIAAHMRRNHIPVTKEGIDQWYVDMQTDSIESSEPNND